MIERNFRSWEEFIEASERPTDCTSRASRTNGAGFKGCTDAQAVEWAKFGWLDGAKRARVTSQMMFDRLGALIERVDIQYDVEGHAIDIARYIEGEPECWMRFEQTMIDGTSPKHIRVLLNISASAGVSVDSLLARGAVTCALIELLEYAGHRVELSIGMKASSSEYYLVRVLVKPFDQPLDLAKVAYVFGHPSVLRYHIFSLMETEPAYIREKIGVNWGYGKPTNMNDDERGDALYIPSAMYGDEQWTNPARAERWVREQLKKQGVELMDERGVTA
jgi:hypothetical protein